MELIKSKRGYKAEFKSGALNKPFWREVLEKRTIKRVVFSEKGINYLLLDNGQKFFLNNPTHPAGCVWIKD